MITDSYTIDYCDQVHYIVFNTSLILSNKIIPLKAYSEPFATPSKLFGISIR